MYSLDYHLIPAHSKQEMELSPCANSRSSSLPFNLCQLFLVLGPGNNWPIPVLSDWLRPVLSDWINPAMGVPPRADKPGKALFQCEWGALSQCGYQHRVQVLYSLASLVLGNSHRCGKSCNPGLGTPIRQGVNCSYIFPLAQAKPI